MLVPLKVYENEEAQHGALARFAEHKQVALLVSLMTEVGGSSEGFGDPLGSLYQEIVSKGRLEQFFTPSPVSDLLGALGIGEQAAAGKTVFDPACGSGKLLLSAAKINRHLQLYGADIDHTLCKVAVVNMLLNSLTGEIAHMTPWRTSFSGATGLAPL